MDGDVRFMVRKIISALQRRAFRYASEDQLQAGIAEALAAEGMEARREVQLSKQDRIDVLCGSVAIEAKIKGSMAALSAQVRRYCENEAVGAVVIASNLGLRIPMGTVIHGKPVVSVHINRQSF